MYVMLNTVQCNLETNTLNTFSEFSSQHIECSGALNDALMAVFIVSSLMIIVMNAFCLIIITNMNASLQWAPFLTDTPLVFMVLQLARM